MIRPIETNGYNVHLLSVIRRILGKFILKIEVSEWILLLEFHVAVCTHFKANENVDAVSMEAYNRTVAIRNPKLITLHMK